jgi:hypothetical protein
MTIQLEYHLNIIIVSQGVKQIVNNEIIQIYALIFFQKLLY